MYRQQATEPTYGARSLSKREEAILMMLRELPDIEQDEVLQVARKEKELADMRARLEALEREKKNA